jgi:hypothetical protein
MLALIVSNVLCVTWLLVVCVIVNLVVDETVAEYQSPDEQVSP